MRSLKFGYVLLALGVIAIAMAVTAGFAFSGPEDSPACFAPAQKKQTKTFWSQEGTDPSQDVLLGYAKDYIATTYTYPKELRVSCQAFPFFARCYVKGPSQNRSIGTWEVICKPGFVCSTKDI